MLDLLTLLLISCVGQVFFPINPEAASVYYGAKLGWHPLFVGLVCATGQLPVQAAVVWGGTGLAARVRWLGRSVARTRERYGDRLERHALAVTALSAVLGFPPILPAIAIAGSFGVRAILILSLTFAGRMLRFTVLAATGATLFPGLLAID